MNQLKDQVAIITGAGTGIGAAAAVRFVQEGASVVIVGRRRQKLEETAARIAQPTRVAVVPGDVQEPGTAAEAVRVARELFGGLDILVNNAAVALPSSFTDTPLDSWRQVFDIILLGCFQFTQAATRDMIAHETAGRVVNVTSVHGTQAEVNMSSYGSAKAAVNQFTRVLAVELAPHNIRCNALAPGFVDTPMSVYEGVNELETEWFQQIYVERRRIPLARAAQPEEMAGPIVFLASQDSSYVTGVVLVADGGLTCTF